MSMNASETIAAITSLRKSPAFKDYFMAELTTKRVNLDKQILEVDSLSDAERNNLRQQRKVLVELEHKLDRDFEQNKDESETDLES